MAESNLEIKELLCLMAKKDSSDLLLAVDSPPILRVHMSLVRTDKPVLTFQSIKDITYPMLNKEQQARFEEDMELDFAYQTGEARFRVNMHYERGNIACSVRRISMKIPSLSELGVPAAVSEFCKFPRGLILITGPTGSGKSTTQASMIDIINNNRACHIITVEDPIEYIHTNKKALIEQREVGIDTKSFANALRVVLRQDPDVILIGEMRDLETIQAALTAAETGHLVISTLHTPDAAQTIDRIIDVFPPHQQSQVRLQLSLVLQGVVAQQLLPKKDNSGVVPSIEILIATSAVRNIIRKATTQDIYSVIETSAKTGMIGMDTALKNLYSSGAITLEEAMNHARNIEELEKRIKAV